MTVKEVNGRWHTVNKAGKVGTRAFKSRESAEAASNRGKALLAAGGGGGTVSSPMPSTVSDSPDTAEERKKLGIAPKPPAKGEF